MNVLGIKYETICDGVGMRTAIFFSGCSHHCKNCQNPKSHDSKNGVELNDELKNIIFNEIEKRPYIRGITLTGGDPLYEGNLKGIKQFITDFKNHFSEKDIWIYTGYTLEELDNERLQIVKMCDTLVDGKYLDEQRDVTLRFRGSKNQRIINVKEI